MLLGVLTSILARLEVHDVDVELPENSLNRLSRYGTNSSGRTKRNFENSAHIDEIIRRS